MPLLHDSRLRDQLPSGQIRDAEGKAKTSRDGAAKAVRNAWSHILYPVKSESTAAGAAFDLEQSSITSKDRPAIPVGTYDKVGPYGGIQLNVNHLYRGEGEEGPLIRKGFSRPALTCPEP